MSSPTQILSAVAPKFDGVDGTRLSAVLAIAASQVSASAFGSQRNLAIAYLAAHMLEIGDSASGTGGLVASEKEGQLERSYGGSQSEPLGARLYGRTVYGQEFVRIRRQCIMGARTRVSNMVIPAGEV